MAGVTISVMRSYSWMPVREVTPMYKKIPKSTARGMRRSMSVITMDIPDGENVVKEELLVKTGIFQILHKK